MKLTKKIRSSIFSGKSIKENLPLATQVSSILGSLGALIAYLTGATAPILYYAIFLLTSLIVILGTWLQSRLDASENTNDLYSFLWNNLYFINSSKLINHNFHFLIIECEKSTGVYEQLVKKFVDIKTDVRFTVFRCDSLDEDLQTMRLLNCLDKAEAVVVVKTKTLRKNPWLLKTLKHWTSENSNVPCVVIDRENSEHSESSLIFTHYYTFHDEIHLLPWLLLRIANENASAWRNQATFNRSVAINILFLLLIALVITYLVNII